MKLAINLASQRHLHQKSLNLSFNLLIVLLLIVLLLLGKTFFSDYQQAQTYQSHLAALQQELLGEQPERIDPEVIEKRHQAHNRAATLLQRDAFRWTVLFDRMEELLPDGVSLRNFQPDYDKNSLEIDGIAKSLPALQTFLDTLQKDQFQRVYLKTQGEVAINNGRGGQVTALSFSISLAGVF